MTRKILFFSFLLLLPYGVTADDKVHTMASIAEKEYRRNTYFELINKMERVLLLYQEMRAVLTPEEIQSYELFTHYCSVYNLSLLDDMYEIDGLKLFGEEIMPMVILAIIEEKKAKNKLSREFMDAVFERMIIESVSQYEEMANKINA